MSSAASMASETGFPTAQRGRLSWGLAQAWAGWGLSHSSALTPERPLFLAEGAGLLRLASLAFGAGSCR